MKTPNTRAKALDIAVMLAVWALIGLVCWLLFDTGARS